MDKQKFFVWCAIKRHLSKNSLRTTEIRYVVLERWLCGRELNSDSAELFVLYLREKGLRNASINSYIRILNLIDIYYKEQDIELNLLKKVSYFPKQTKIPTFLTIDEIEAILSVNKIYKRRNGVSLEETLRLDETYRLAIWVLAGTGCRFSEMANLKKENFSYDAGYLEFKDTKNNEDRRVPIPPNLNERLYRFTKEKKPNNYIFTSSLHRRIDARIFNEELRKRSRDAGVKKHVYAHCFRNSYIKEHRKSGTSVQTLAKLVGHRDLNTTLGYDRFDFDDLLKEAENHPLFSKQIEPIKIVNRLKSLIEQLRLQQDARFNLKIVESSGKFMLSIAFQNLSPSDP